MPLGLATSPEARPDRPRWRLGLAPLMGLVAVVAAGLALVKVAPEGSPECVEFLFLVSLLVGMLALIVRRDRAPWAGFALFGWSYALVALVPPIQHALEDRLPGDEIIDRLVLEHFHSIPPEPAQPLAYEAVRIGGRYYREVSGFYGRQVFQPTPEEAGLIDDYSTQVDDRRHRLDALGRARRVLHGCAGLAFALLGAILGRALADRDPRPAGSPTGASVRLTP